MSLAMWQARAIERSTALNVSRDTLLRSADIVTGALGLEWLDKQALLAARPERIISDVHLLYRSINSSSDSSIVGVCELATYLQQFASDPAIATILDDLRADKYEATVLELALAHRWRKAGAAVILQPPVPNGVADFAAVIQDVRFVVEASTFPSDDLSDQQHRAATIVTKAVDSVVKQRLPVALKIVIREYVEGDFEGQLRKAVRDVCSSLLASPDSPPPISTFTFGSICAEAITARTEPITDSYGAPAPFSTSGWDVAMRIVERWKPPGAFTYVALEGPPVRETIRLFMKLPNRSDDLELSARVAKKLKKEKAQLTGVNGPRLVILDVTALARVGLSTEDQNLTNELQRMMRNTPELVGVWLLTSIFPARARHEYSGRLIANTSSTYELPSEFFQRLVDQEGEFDFVNDEPHPRSFAATSDRSRT